MRRHTALKMNDLRNIFRNETVKRSSVFLESIRFDTLIYCRFNFTDDLCRIDFCFLFQKIEHFAPSFHHFITTCNYSFSRFLYYVLQKCCRNIFPNCINARKPCISKGFRAFVSHSVLFPLNLTVKNITILS